ncbi:T9SS type B sorting domain-containing protein [Flavobacterium terrisoli]|uniref:T9SS type B sorting domain-containing protein n=1 Tax=Flavobacterium terrisoli TaxID=3242195 RepID=UPI002542D71A|nr:T9SS type B sorting domain-containing protein [Flavobacterium buctense]
MNHYKKIFSFLLLLLSATGYSQLGFCGGSKGDPIFSENFGNGTNYGPALPAGITNYSFVVGNPNDGSYTLYYRTNLYSTWHYSLDHTPDAMNGTNGKALIVNANASTTGDFYKRTVTGLCANTTFEFSAWLMNIYNPGSGFCGAGEIPINVRFEIWNDTETVLLGSGNTGSIMGSAAPLWQQFALVFTTVSETSVVLKMKNNGLGGCGNDLAIDDIEFRSCGDLTTITSPSVVGDTFVTCQTPISIALQAVTAGVGPYFYQWQSSTNGGIWTDIPGETHANLTTPSLSTTTYFRTKIAQDIANINNPFCSTLSNVFTVSFLAQPTNSVSNGDQTICSNQSIPALTVTATAGNGVNWYDAATGGNLLLANSTSFTPTTPGTYYAETYNTSSNCINSTRVPVSLTIISQPTAAISGTNSVCTGSTAVIAFNGTPNAIVTYNIDSGSYQTITLNASGSATLTTPALTANNTYHLVSVALNTCSATLTGSAAITVNSTATASVSGNTSVCNGGNATLTFSGTANATVTYNINSGANQTVVLNAAGTATAVISNITSTTVCNLISVTSAGANACTQLLSQSFTISVVALPTATISANPTAVCANQTSTISFTGTANAIVTYTVNGGANQTITLNASGQASVTTPNITSNTTFQLVSVALSGTLGCSQSVSGSATVSINPTPIANFTGSLNYCSGETTAITLTADIAGTTFSWTATQTGVTGSTSGTGNQINQTLTNNNTANGTATYIVTPFYSGCAGLPITINATVYPIPKPTIADGVICLNSGSTPSSQFHTLTTNLSPTQYSFVWYFEGALIPTAHNSFYNAYQIGTYSVIATHLVSGCVSDLAFAEITESSQGESLIIDQSSAFSDNPRIVVTVVGGDGPFLYQLDGGEFQSSNIFTDVSSGTHTITVVDDTYCTNLSTTVTIINYPHYFTPNGDGIHETWNIKGVNGNARIIIFDRYGKILTQISPSTPGWDGTYNGHMMFADDYWFTIEYLENGSEKTFRAHFTLKR